MRYQIAHRNRNVDSRRISKSIEMPSTLRHDIADLKGIDFRMLRREGNDGSWGVAQNVQLGNFGFDLCHDVSGGTHDGFARLQVPTEGQLY